MITSSRMAAVDRNSAALGIPRKQLMESSGGALARRIQNVADTGSTVTLVCGRGNNGGDAFVAARFLSDYETRVYLLGRPETIQTEIARENWDALGNAEISRRMISDPRAIDFDESDVIVDAMLGTGVTGQLREPEATCTDLINQSQTPVVSVDVPSGIDADTGEREGVAVDADHVVTFHDSKPGLESVEATITVADIGIPDAAERFTGPGDLLGLSRIPHGHKGEHGEVLVVGGGPYTGAPALAGQAALRAGADLVRVVVPEPVAREVQSYSEDLIVRPLPGDRIAPPNVDQLRDLVAAHDSVVVGPGLGDSEASQSAVADLLECIDGRVIVDADALSMVPTVETDAKLVCTPHRGELADMGGPAVDDPRNSVEAIETYAAELDITLLVKAQTDLITDGHRHRLNRTGTPAMTVGGTGDVLAGAVGALVCRSEPLQAAAIGAYANGRAGTLATEGRNRGLLATDLPDALPEALSDD